VRLSAQEMIDCDKNNFGCEGGYVTRALNWGKRRGFIPEECLPYNGTKATCDLEEYLLENECRVNNNLYKVIDYCLA